MVLLTRHLYAGVYLTVLAYVCMCRDPHAASRAERRTKMMKFSEEQARIAASAEREVAAANKRKADALARQDACGQAASMLRTADDADEHLARIKAQAAEAAAEAQAAVASAEARARAEVAAAVAQAKAQAQAAEAVAKAHAQAAEAVAKAAEAEAVARAQAAEAAAEAREAEAVARAAVAAAAARSQKAVAEVQAAVAAAEAQAELTRANADAAIALLDTVASESRGEKRVYEEGSPEMMYDDGEDTLTGRGVDQGPVQHQGSSNEESSSHGFFDFLGEGGVQGFFDFLDVDGCVDDTGRDGAINLDDMDFGEMGEGGEQVTPVADLIAMGVMDDPGQEGGGDTTTLAEMYERDGGDIRLLTEGGGGGGLSDLYMPDPVDQAVQAVQGEGGGPSAVNSALYAVENAVREEEVNNICDVPQLLVAHTGIEMGVVEASIGCGVFNVHKIIAFVQGIVDRGMYDIFRPRIDAVLLQLGVPEGRIVFDRVVEVGHIDLADAKFCAEMDMLTMKQINKKIAL